MALIVITSTEDFISVEFNDASSEWVRSKLKRTQARSVCQMIDDKGVEIIWSDSHTFIMKHQYIDTIDGIEITSNEILFNELTKLMK